MRRKEQTHERMAHNWIHGRSEPKCPPLTLFPFSMALFVLDAHIQCLFPPFRLHVASSQLKMASLDFFLSPHRHRYSLFFLIPDCVRKCLPYTVGQKNQEYRLEYWATHSSIRSFAHTAHSFACALLCARALSCSLTSLTPSLVGQ